MNPLRPTKVYVPQEAPDHLTDKCASGKDGYCDFPAGSCKQCFPRLKEQSLFCFSKEELEIQFLFVMSEGYKSFDPTFKTTPAAILEEFKQHIKQLLP